MSPNKALTTLGLAHRAGMTAIGWDRISDAARSGLIELLLVAEDCSASSRKAYLDKCRYYQIEQVDFADKQTLAHAVGRREIAAVAVCDKGFAESIRKGMKGKINGGDAL